MKNVLHIWQSHYPWEVRVGKINRALQSRGDQVMVLARGSEGQVREERLDGVRIRRVQTPHRALSTPVPGNIFWSREIAMAIEDCRADLVLVRDIPLAPMAAKIARKKGIPVLLDMAEHYPEAMRSWKKYSDNPILRKLVHDWKLPDRIEASAVALADGILVVCEEQKERLVQEYAYPEGRVCIVLNTPELETWKNFPRGTSKARPNCFGYHGILCDDRELEVVLRGFDLAAQKDPEISLLMAGGGESEPSLRALARTLVSRERIRFTGRYKPEQLASLYEEADFGIVSLRANRFTEHTVANKFFDYAALGKPFLFTDVNPLVRIMEKMNCGLSFRRGDPQDAGDAFLKLRKMDYLELGRNGLEAVNREFNWAEDSRRLLQFTGQSSWGSHIKKRA